MNEASIKIEGTPYENKTIKSIPEAAV